MLDEIARKFFDPSSDCPNEIPDCENIRKEYFDELNRLKANSQCSPCIERRVKNDFINKFKSRIQ